MKERTIATCQECGAQMPRWVGRCPECGGWGSVVEERVGPAQTAAAPAGPVEVRSLADHDAEEAGRIPTGIDEVDRVLGGGLVRGSITLLAGEPGIGKSTLMLQAALGFADARVLLVCGEEAPSQVRARAERIGGVPGGIVTTSDPSLPNILAALEAGSPEIAVVDSIQTVHDPALASAPGSVAQVRECGARLARVARERGIAIVLVGHVTKEGAVAGPRVLEHQVDVVLNFEGDRSGGVRILRALKNRFGSTDEVGFFRMSAEGLVAIREASRYLLADRCPGLPGSIMAVCVEGRRPFVIEIQSLVTPSTLPMPRRTALGVDGGRLPLIIAVIQRRLAIKFAESDIFVSAVGGIRAAEPAADLPVILAILSSRRGVALPDDLAAFGEVGLAGEVRSVQAADRRLAEARSVGVRRVIVPHRVETTIDGLETIRVRNVKDIYAFVETAAPHPV